MKTTITIIVLLALGALAYYFFQNLPAQTEDQYEFTQVEMNYSDEEDFVYHEELENEIILQEETEVNLEAQIQELEALEF